MAADHAVNDDLSQFSQDAVQKKMKSYMYSVSTLALVLPCIHVLCFRNLWIV